MIRAHFLTKPTQPEITDVIVAASGPWYRGSNPCLPANNQRSISHVRIQTHIAAIVRKATCARRRHDATTATHSSTYRGTMLRRGSSGPG